MVASAAGRDRHRHRAATLHQSQHHGDVWGPRPSWTARDTACKWEDKASERDWRTADRDGLVKSGHGKGENRMR